MKPGDDPRPEGPDRATMRRLAEKYGGEKFGPIPTAEEARMMAQEDAVDAMATVRSQRGDADAHPTVSILDPDNESSFNERLSQAERDYWPDEIRDEYFNALVLDLAAGNVAFVQRLTDYEGVTPCYVVDLDVWEPVSPDFRLGKVWRSSPEPDSDWRPRSRWRRMRLRWKGVRSSRKPAAQIR